MNRGFKPSLSANVFADFEGTSYVKAWVLLQSRQNGLLRFDMNVLIPSHRTFARAEHELWNVCPVLWTVKKI